jgi:O-acetylserine/cysteine efflux transporter
MRPFHVAALILVTLVWGINFVAVKVGLWELPPLFLCFARFLIMSIPAVFFVKRPSVPFKWVILYSLLMFVIQFSLMFSGIHAGITPALASLLLQTQVFFCILFANLTFREKIHRFQILGALVAFSGIGIVALNLDASTTPTGTLLTLASAAVWGMGSVIVKKMGKVETFPLLIWSSLIAWPPLLALTLFFENGASILLNAHNLSLYSYGAIAFISLGSTAFGFGVWNRLLQIYPLSTVAPFTLLIPIFGMLASHYLLGEPLQSWKLLAAGLVVGGLCINLFLKSPKISVQS